MNQWLSGYYLVGLDKDGNMVTNDGAHNTPAGVAKARYLHEELFEKPHSWKMVQVMEAPGSDGTGVDPEALEFTKGLVKAHEAQDEDPKG